MRKMSCEEVHEAIPQFALDILPSGIRALVASHLLRCPTCRIDMAGAQKSAAELLDGPIPSFDMCDEENYYDDDFDPGGIQEDWHPSPRRSRLRMVVTIAAAGLLIVGTTLGPELSQASSARAVPIAQAPLLGANETTVGYVYIFAGNSHDIEVRIVGVVGVSRLFVELLGAGGSTIGSGQFSVVSGRGAWAESMSSRGSKLAEVVVLDTSGKQVASAMVA